MNLYCLPHAGGSAAIFKKWEKELSPNVKLIAPELAGRGKRTGDPLYKDLQEAIDDVISQIDLQHPFALYGHSMGALLAFEVTRQLQLSGHPIPVHLFIVGRGAPQIEAPAESVYHDLNDEAFKQKLKELGGTPDGFFEDDQLFQFFLPVLRNDFDLAANYFPERTIIALNTKITVLLGKEEDIGANRVDGWKYHSRHAVHVIYCNGGHFFVNDDYGIVCKIIYHELYMS